MLKNLMIAAATFAVSAAKDDLEMKVRDLVAAEQSPPDWLATVPHDGVTSQTTQIGGAGGTGADLAGALVAAGYTGTEAYTELGSGAAVLKSATQPAPFAAVVQTFDSVASEWSPGEAVEVVWAPLV